MGGRERTFAKGDPEPQEGGGNTITRCLFSCEVRHNTGVTGSDLQIYVEAARRGWPNLRVDLHAFAAHAARHAAAKGLLLPLENAPDLYLAFACAARVPGASEAFEQAFGRVIARVLARRRANADVADDAGQTLRERLLVAPPGGIPKIAEYAGVGPLKSWVAATAATTVLMMFRSQDRRREDSDEGGAAAAIARDAGPELLYLQERYKNELQEAVARALSRLNERDRTMLKLHLAEGVSIDAVGALYNVDRSTAARWINAARASLVTLTRADVRERLGLTDGECDSIAALVRSQLHVSFVRLLK